MYWAGVTRSRFWGGLTLDARRRALLVEGTHAAQVALLFAVQVVQGHRGFGS